MLDCIYWYLADPALFQIGNLLSETLVLRFLGADSVPLAATLLLQGRAKPPNDQRMKFLEKLFFPCVPGCLPRCFIIVAPWLQKIARSVNNDSPSSAAALDLLGEWFYKPLDRIAT